MCKDMTDTSHIEFVDALMTIVHRDKMYAMSIL
jgi:hypothetical protein